MQTKLLPRREDVQPVLPAARIDHGAAYLHGYSFEHKEAIEAVAAAITTAAAAAAIGSSIPASHRFQPVAVPAVDASWNPVQMIAASHKISVSLSPAP